MVLRTAKTWTMMGALAVASLAVGCDEDDDPMVTPTDAGPKDSGTDSGPMITIDSGPVDSGPQGLMCGTDGTCQGIDLSVVQVSPCCADANTCGVDLADLEMFVALNGCAPLMDEGEPSAFCDGKLEALEIDSDPMSDGLQVAVGSFGNLNVPGCCRPDNTCGAQLDNVDIIGVQSFPAGLGCQDFQAFGGLFPGGNAPAPIPCTYGGGGGDGGTDAAADAN